MNQLRSTALVATLALAAGTAIAAPFQYYVYNYTATVNSAATFGEVSFAAGDTVTGSVYLRTGIANTTTWAYPGENAVYVDAVEAFTFTHSDVSVLGTGGGNVQISNNRRFVASGGGYSDGFDSVLGTETGNHFATSAPLSVSALSMALNTNFLTPGDPNLSAITGLSYPNSALNVPLFNLNHNVTLGLVGGSQLVATVQTVTVSFANSVPSAIPEPSAFAAIAGCGVLGLAATRRRRRA